MDRHAIAPERWPEFVDAFSRQHEGWLISVSVDGRCLVRDVPLMGVVAELDETGAMMVFTGGLTHFVEHPVTLSVGETSDGAEADVTIGDQTGTSTTIALRSPMRPELVDGMP